VKIGQKRERKGGRERERSAALRATSLSGHPLLAPVELASFASLWFSPGFLSLPAMRSSKSITFGEGEGARNLATRDAAKVEEDEIAFDSSGWLRESRPSLSA
jgi:hypothetical protein